MRPKSNQCHCQALEKVSLGRAMLLVRYNWILRGVSFILFALGSPVLPKIDFFLLNFLFCKISWKFQFSVKWLHPKAKFKKGDPLKIQFYLTDTISQPNDTFSRAWQWHWFDFGLIFTFLLANWWFAARFSSCSSSLNFEAKINFYTTKENCRKCRAKCTGLKLDLGPFSGSQNFLLFNRISWWPCKIAKLRTSQRFVFSCSCHCCRIISKTGCGMDPTSLAFFPQSLTGMPPGCSKLIDSVESGNNLSDDASPPARCPELPHKLAKN